MTQENKQQDNNTWSLSLFQKSTYVKKKLDLYLWKIQISSFIQEKSKSASNEDAGLFFIKENSDLHLRKM